MSRLGHAGRTVRRVACVSILSAISGVAFAQISPQTSPAAAQPLPPAAPTAVPTPAPMLTVPRVLDRPLGLEEGPRLVVQSFRLTGAQDHPKLGITTAALNAELDAAIKAQPAEGYTINQLQQVATKLSEFYHKRGMILAQVIVPAQDIHDGVVELHVLEGILEAVKVENNKHNRGSALIAPFKPLIGRAFEQAPTDSALLRLTEYPGLSVFGVVTPGTAVGTSDLILRVQREQAVEVGLSADNFGTKVSGEDRGNLSLRWNSPFGVGDRLSLYGLRSETSGDSAAHTTYGGVDYRIPMFAARGALALNYSVNSYDAGENLDVTGKVHTGMITYHQEFYRSRRALFYGELAGADKKADITFPAGLPGEEHVRDISALVGWRYSDTARGFNDFSLSYVHGSLATPDASHILPRAGEASSYSIASFRLQRQQGLTRYQSLVITVGGQYTSDAVATLDEIALGGPTNSRGYGVADYVGDEGTYGSLEWVIGAPGFASKPGFAGKTWGDLLQFSLFADAAHGKSNLGTSTTSFNLPPASLNDWGVALQIVLPNRFYARVSWAKPISEDPVIKTVDPKTSHVYGTIGLTF